MTGQSIFGLDSLSIEMAHDKLQGQLVDYPTAAEAFELWFITRYPFYAHIEGETGAQTGAQSG